MPYPTAFLRDRIVPSRLITHHTPVMRWLGQVSFTRS
jgi:hypothetical protein